MSFRGLGESGGVVCSPALDASAEVVAVVGHTAMHLLGITPIEKI